MYLNEFPRPLNIGVKPSHGQSVPPTPVAGAIIVDPDGHALVTQSDRLRWRTIREFRRQAVTLPDALAPREVIIAAHATKPTSGGNGGHGYV